MANSCAQPIRVALEEIGAIRRMLDEAAKRLNQLASDLNGLIETPLPKPPGETEDELEDTINFMLERFGISDWRDRAHFKNRAVFLLNNGTGADFVAIMIEKEMLAMQRRKCFSRVV